MSKELIYLMLFCYFQLPAMENLCQLVPVMNGIEYENGPILELCVAQQSPLFNNLYDDIPTEKGMQRRFLLPEWCDVEMAWTFASCLTKQYELSQALQNEAEEQRLQEIRNYLTSHIHILSPEEKIGLCNIADFALVESLKNDIVDELLKGEIDRELFLGMNTNVRKKIASVVIPKHTCDTTLLQKYSEHLREREYVLEREGIVAKLLATYKKRICYFNEDTNTIIGTIKENKVFKIDKKIHGFYIAKLGALQRISTTLSWLYKKICKKLGYDDEMVIDIADYNIKKIYSIDMSNDETCFIVRVMDKGYNKKFFMINIAAKTITEIIPQHFVAEKKDVFSMELTDNSVGSDSYRICNIATDNAWSFYYHNKEIFLVNRQQIIRKKKESYSDNKGSTNHYNKTVLIHCIDDIMRSFATDIERENLSLVIYTIINQQNGRVALYNQEYEEYENLPAACRSMIDSMYVITKKGLVWYCVGVLSTVYRTIIPWVKTVFVLCLSAVPLLVIAQILSYFGIKYKRATKGLELLLRL